MGAATMKIMPVVILSFEATLVSSPILQLLSKKVTNKYEEKFVSLTILLPLPPTNNTLGCAPPSVGYC